MRRDVEALLLSWNASPGIACALLVVAAVYLRGWWTLGARAPGRWPTWRAVAFVAGLATLWIAVASPLDAFAGLLLSAHMVQHLLLMMVAPPLLLLGAPLVPLLRGLPRAVARDGLGPFLVWPALRRTLHALTHPVVCWLALVATTWAWHVPALYELALRSDAWHRVEHACFLDAATLFWWPVVQPWPSRRRWPDGAIVLYLLLADVQNTIFSAWLVFSDRVLYPVYASAPRLFGGTALEDQTAAGVVMWVPGSIAFLIPAMLITARWLAPRTVPVRSPVVQAPKLVTARAGFDLLALPIVGRVLRARAGRRAMQAVLLLLALAVVVDGLVGPQMGAMNLAGVLPWTYWRGFAVVALLAAGNFFCMACPFMLPRELGRRLGGGTRPWPRMLRSKWLAVALLVTFVWAYEVGSLWDRPAWTAAIVVAYFAAAFAVDAVFAGASFCKWVCPIGQFHFATSTVSPLDVRVRAPAVCADCRTHDCLRGNAANRGCELDLFLPQKTSGMDCTFCLDCVRACPQDNVGILAVVPGSSLWSDGRSAIGRLARRPDVAALALVLVFGAFVNAVAMVEPVVRWRDELTAALGFGSTIPVTSALMLLALVVLPLALVVSVVAAGRAIAGETRPVGELVCRLAPALLPLGIAMWAAHVLFHLLAGWRSLVPVLERVIVDVGLGATAPRWALSTSGVAPDTLLAVVVGLLDVGLLLALYAGWRVAPRPRLLAPWAALAVALWMGGVWTFLQPMAMRGMVH